MNQEFMNMCGFIIAMAFSIFALIAMILGIIAIIAELRESHFDRKMKELEYKKFLKRQKKN